MPLEPVADYEGPSDNIISDCFLFDFKWIEHLYNTHMSQLTATSFSCDHTFKIAASIGLKRKSDGKWERQYDSVFFVMNENGEVISWQLTKGTIFALLKLFLLTLKNDLKNKESSLTFVLLIIVACGKPSCGQFSQSQRKKLDLFHAVQRVLYNNYSKTRNLIGQYPCRMRQSCTGNLTLLRILRASYELKIADKKHFNF